MLALRRERADPSGTPVRAEIQEDPGDGLFKNSKGYPLRRIRRADDDRIWLGLANPTAWILWSVTIGLLGE